jgi:anti-sigma regulatory factor (Ser/Thr protein kinase)
VVLALGEACANVIRHAFPNGEGDYVVGAEMDDNELRLWVEDEGVGLDPSAITRDWVEPEATSGRGLTIIRELMHSVDVGPAPTGCGTRLVMRKRLAG